MSFNNSLTQAVPSSNHSLFTPSYTADVLVPIQCQELELEPSLPITSKIFAKEASPIPKKAASPIPKSPSPRTSEPIQYQKLKMNYLRRLNVVPIVSQKDVLALIGKEQAQSKEHSKGRKSSLEGEKPSKISNITERTNKANKKK